jgi:polysaccharide export outer membrane protein
MAALLLVFVFYSPPLVLADSPGDSGAYRIAPGDRITVTVFGQTELSGEVLVDGEGNILLPLVGTVEVKNLTALECQKLIVRRLADGILNQPVVSVRISDLRPLYVLGFVRVPGAYPFRYGSTVKSAVAAAGGFGLPEPGQNASMSEFLLADERVRELSFQKQSLLIRQARIEAERDGLKTFSAPSSLDHSDDNDVTEIVKAEKEMLDSQAAILQNQLNLLRSQRPRLQNEIGALNAQIATEKKQIELIKQHADQYSGLVKQGLGLANAELQFQLSEASHQSELWRLTAEVSRLQMESGELDLKVLEAETLFKKRIIAELREVRDRLGQLDITLPSAREIREVKLQQAGSLARADAARSISIMRTRNGEPTVLQATDTTLLEPGDIIDVKQLLPKTLHQSVSAGAAIAHPHQTEKAGATAPLGSISQ